MLRIHPGSRPYFSVIIPVFNRAHLLVRALDSLLQQTEKDWEALVVDDGSTDMTGIRVHRYINDTRVRIRYLYHTHRGTAYSRNAGILAASGRYITFLDSDDWYRPEHLRMRRRFLESHPDVDFLYGGLEVRGNPYVPDVYRPGRYIHVKECAVAGTFVAPREVFMEIGGFPPVPFAEDARLMEEVRRQGLNVVRLDIPTYVYDRTHRDSTTFAFAAPLALPGDDQT